MSDDDESLLTYLAGMDARIDRLEGQLEQVLSALATLTEIGLLTYAATGTKTTIPGEVFDDPIAEQAIRRNPVVIEAIRERRQPPGVPVHRTYAELAVLFLHGTAEEIAAEPRLAGALRAQEIMELHIDALYEGEPSSIPAAYVESRQLIADALARGQDVDVKLLEPTRDGKTSEAWAGPER